METGRPPQTKKRQRPHDLDTTITDIRPAKKHCRIAVGPLSIPKNDARAYRNELRQRLFFPYIPSDNTSSQRAREQYMDRRIYGSGGHYTVEKLILDLETRIPWQVPKVVLEFKRTSYLREEQECTRQAEQDDGVPVSPCTVPTPQQMSRMEYEDAVQAGDSRVALDAKHVFEFCQDAEIGWLKYEDR